MESLGCKITKVQKDTCMYSPAQLMQGDSIPTKLDLTLSPDSKEGRYQENVTREIPYSWVMDRERNKESFLT